MFGFMKSREEKERKKKEKIEKEQQRSSKSLTADELIRLEEAKHALERKTPNGASDDSMSVTSSEASIESASAPQRGGSQKGKSSVVKPTKAPPKPPKKGILKDKSLYGGLIPNQGVRGNVDDTITVEENTLANEILSGVTADPPTNVRSVVLPFDRTPGSGSKPAVMKKPKQSAGISRVSSKATSAEPPAAKSTPVVVLPPSPAEKSYDADLQLPSVAAPLCPKSRDLILRRQASGDFGFTLRKGAILERAAESGGAEHRRAVIFAEPGPKSLNTGLLPGDRLIEVNGSNVELLTREAVIEIIKSCGDSVQLQVQTIPELSELSLRSAADGGEVATETPAGNSGTLKRSGSLRYQNKQKKSEDELSAEKVWLSAERVWLVHRGGFAAARVLKTGTPGVEGLDQLPEGKCKVKLEHGGEVLEVDEDDVEKANPPKFDRVEDLASLRYLNESCLLHTLRQRYGSNLIHSYAGESLIIVNPMHQLSIYTDKVIQMFKGCKPEDMPPHVYATAQNAYRNLLSQRRDQAILLIGRSGSGKTTNARHILQYYTTAYGSVNNILTVEKLNAIFALIDNFGNSRTILNTNATHYTQITTIDFDNVGLITSASIQALMFEKSRIVRRPDGEPAFHVLYQMLAGLETPLRKEFHLENVAKETNSFLAPIQHSEDHQLAAQTWAKLRHCFTLLKFSEAETKAVCSVLAAIYHLGVAGSTKGPNNKYQFQRPASAQHAAEILGTTIEELVRMVFAGGSQRATAVTDKDASTECDVGSDALEGFVIGLYQELFQAVVSLINRSLSSSYRSISSVLVVDTPGFRDPSSCGRESGATLEDLCHNYVQERLQLLFHDTVFTAKQDLYSQENISLDFEPISSGPASMVALMDRTNQSLVRTPGHDLGESDLKGLLWSLDEEAITVGASDETIFERVKESYITTQRTSLMALSGEPGCFVLNHFEGTSPVKYNTAGWIKACRENPITRVAGVFLIDSNKSEISDLFSTTCRSSTAVMGSVVGLEGGTSLHRASSKRRTFTSGGTSVKRRSICLHVKFQTDSLMEILRRTRTHFIHCILPQHSAGLCELRGASTTPPAGAQATGASPTLADGAMLNVPLVRLQIRGAQILDAVRLHRQGYPEHLQFKEFRRRFEILLPSAKATEPVADEKLAVQQLLQALDVDQTIYKLGLSQVLFHSGGLSQLEYVREEKLSDWVTKLQAVCRSHLAHKRRQKLKLQHLAASCVQRNIRKLMAIREWHWWRLYTKVKPLLNVHRTEEELRERELELEQLRQKLEKSEKERAEYKLATERLEARLTEIVADLQEENSTSNQASEMLERETADRIRLEKELKELQVKFSGLEQVHRRTEMELMDAKMLATVVDSDLDEDSEESDSIFRQKFERLKRESELAQKKHQQQLEEESEQFEANKKSLERKLAESVAESEEHQRVIAAMKRKTQRLNQDLTDFRLHVEEQTTRNAELEKKQRKFDLEMAKVADQLKAEKIQREKVQREKEELATQKYTTEQELKNVKVDLELQTEKIQRIEAEMLEMATSGKGDKEIIKLRQQKNELERKVKDQEEELDEQAGTIQQLEQAKLRMEMAQEKLRQQHAKELEEKEQELETLKGSTQKKLRAMEVQLEEEYDEKQKFVREKRELERKIEMLSQQKPVRDKDVELMLRRDLKRTKALLQDAQLMLQKYKEGAGSRSTVKQLRSQLEDAEFAAAAAVKARKGVELELQDVQKQLEDMTKTKQEAEERCQSLNREKNDLQSRLDENEEEMTELMRKYKAAVQQHSVDLITFQSQSQQIEALQKEKESLKEEMAMLQSRTEYFQVSTVDRETITRLEAKIRDLEAKLEFEQSTKHRAEVQLGRLKEQVDAEAEEKQNLRAEEAKNQEQNKRLQRQVRDLEEEQADLRRKEAEAVQRKNDLEKKVEALEIDYDQSQNDLQLAFKRIADLQAVIEDNVDDYDDSDDLDSDFAPEYGSDLDEDVKTSVA